MVRDLGKKVLLWGLVLVSFLPVGAARALSDERIHKYDNYQIYFYNPEQECVPGSTRPGSGGPGYKGDEVWDGSCSSMSASRIEWVKKYLSAMQKAATKNGIPWELIPAQTFQESGGGKSEACDNNPLGLKAKSGHPACSNGFAKFNSHEEAFDYYMNSIIPIKELKHKYPNDPYSAVAFIQYGASHPYASCDSESYSQCVGHMGEPTPGYVQSVSSIICGIQKWAKSEGIAISSVTWETYSPEEVAKEEEEEEEKKEEEEEEEKGNSAIYCDDSGNWSDEDDEYVEPEAGNLESYVKAWAWPEYHSPVYKQRRQAYAEYMDTVATHHPFGGVDCGAFVANIMKASGWDPNYVQGGTDDQQRYLMDNWDEVPADSLKIGDVGVKKSGGHVILYVGNISGFGSKTASASKDERAPMAGGDSDKSLQEKYRWYRKG